MKNLSAGEIITLDNQKEFICVSRIVEDGRSYVFLMSNFKPLEIMFAEETVEGEDLCVTIVKSQEKKMHLLNLFQTEMRKDKD